MRKPFIFTVPVIMFALLIGCTYLTRMGADIDAQKAEQIVKGQTTKNEVVRLFGQPQDKTIDSVGKVKWIYRYTELIYKRNVVFGQINGNYNLKKLEVLFEGDLVIDYIYVTAVDPIKLR